MKLHSYLGGITVKSHKTQSKDCEIKSLVPQADMVYPLLSYGENVVIPCVAIGDKVKIGQKIACAQDDMLGVFSSVSGVVKAIEDRAISNKTQKTIIIENDNNYEEDDFYEVIGLDQMDYDDITEIVGKYGIREYDSSQKPLYEKLKYAKGKSIEYVIINAVECEPYFTSVYRRILEEPELIVNGIKVLRHLFPKAEIVMAIGEDKMDAVIEMEKRLKNEPDTEVAAIENKYPSGDFIYLIYQILGNVYKSDTEAIQNGVISVLADTVCALSTAVLEGIPPMSRVITLSGSESNNPGNYEVLFGTSVDDVIKLSGGVKQEPYMIVNGGVFKGEIIENTDIPVTAGVEGILLLSKKEAPIYEPEECIRCGRCMNVCPDRLVPEKLLKYAVSGKTAGFLKWHGDECSLCGCCSYVCPAHIPLMGYIKDIKSKINKEGEK